MGAGVGIALLVASLTGDSDQGNSSDTARVPDAEFVGDVLDGQVDTTGQGGLVHEQPAWRGLDEGANYRGDRLRQGDILRPGDYLASENLIAVLYVQPDGNVILAASGARSGRPAQVI